MKLKGIFLFFALSFVLSSTAYAQLGRVAQLWLTTWDRSELFARAKADLRFSNSRNQFPTIHVHDNQRFQLIDGFGFVLTDSSAELLMRMAPGARPAFLKELFSVHGNGIGVSFLGIGIGSSDMNDHVSSYDDMPAGAADVDLKHFSLDPDRKDLIPVLKEILTVDPAMKTLASPWSPPTWMKTNDNSIGGRLKPEYYGAYAQSFLKCVAGVRRQAGATWENPQRAPTPLS